MVEGDGLENRRLKGPWVRILPPPPYILNNFRANLKTLYFKEVDSFIYN